MSDGNAPTLPGLATGAGRRQRLAVEETIAALLELELLEPRHAGLLELARSLARIVDEGRDTPAVLAARQLLDVLAALPEPAERVADADEWARFAEEFGSAGT